MQSNTKSSPLGKKIQEVRKAEGLTQPEFCALLEIPLDTVKGYESGRAKQVGSSALLKITNHPRFKKYALWLVTDDVIPEKGQISPRLTEVH